MTNAEVAVDTDSHRNLHFTQSQRMRVLLIQIKPEEKHQESKAKGGKSKCLFIHLGGPVIEIQKNYRM